MGYTLHAAHAQSPVMKCSVLVPQPMLVLKRCIAQRNPAHPLQEEETMAKRSKFIANLNDLSNKEIEQALLEYEGYATVDNTKRTHKSNIKYWDESCEQGWVIDRFGKEEGIAKEKAKYCCAMLKTKSENDAKYGILSAVLSK